MSVLTAPAPTPPAPPAAAPAEQRFLLDGVSWESYVAIADALPERSGLHLTYDRGRLEFMTLSPEHERTKGFLRRLIETMADESETPLLGFGSMTCRRQEKERGAEPDECYYLSNLERMRGVQRLDLRIHPPPDLVVEIEVSRSVLDRLAIYSGFGVPEVWRFDGVTLRFLRRGPEGSYVEVPRSPTFPQATAADLVRFVRQGEAEDQTSMVRAFRAWLRQQQPPPPPTSQGPASEGGA
jgi:Uma2 family endonuclease